MKLNFLEVRAGYLMFLGMICVIFRVSAEKFEAPPINELDEYSKPIFPSDEDLDEYSTTKPQNDDDYYNEPPPNDNGDNVSFEEFMNETLANQTRVGKNATDLSFYKDPTNETRQDTDTLLWKEVDINETSESGTTYDDYISKDSGKEEVKELVNAGPRADDSSSSQAPAESGGGDPKDQFGFDKDENTELVELDITGYNDSNIYIGKKNRRGTYITTVTIPTFVVISLTVGFLFVLLHMPNCCFGIFREPPSWEDYGKPKEEEDEYDMANMKQPGCI